MVLFGGDSARVNENGPGILYDPKGVSDALGLLTGQRATVMHRFMCGLSVLPDRSYDSVVLQFSAIA